MAWAFFFMTTSPDQLRLGLCCIFRDAPIKFVTTTATSILRLSREAALEKLDGLCLANAAALQSAFEFCVSNSIGSFRVLSQILPLKTHPTCGYAIDELPSAAEITRRFKSAGRFAKKHGLRSSFHPDQFVVLNSPRVEVVEASLKEIEYQTEVARWIGADVVNIHGGGAYGDKHTALALFAMNARRLSAAARKRLTIENDDKIYAPRDLLPVCRELGIPLVYDVHHHRCLPDGLSVSEVTDLAIATWNREPLFHLSSPIEGWDGPKPERHHDFIDPSDFPDCWRGRSITVEVEAKAKEAAVLKLASDLRSR